MKHLIYKLTSKTSGKHYIGQTKNTLTKRLYGHTASARGKSNNHIHNAIRKYGIDDFDISIIEDDIPMASDLKLKTLISNIREIAYVKAFNSYEEGYNMDMGGGLKVGYIVTQETRDKISEATKGKKKKPFTEEHKENIRKVTTGKSHSTETRKKIGDKARGVKLPPRSYEQKKKYAKKIGIFNNKNELLLTSETNFANFCGLNDLPFKQFKKSYQEDGSLIYENLSKASMSTLNRYKQLHNFFRYKGWYAKKL